jgi:RNA polymerase sigma-70 factor (ECF subfamily)
VRLVEKADVAGPALSAVDGGASDDALVARARARDATAFELLMRRHNQRVYRVVRSLLRDGPEIDDVIQQAYLQAFQHLDQFTGAASWSTWMCRIAINEALTRLRQRGRFISVDTANEDAMSNISKAPDADPERAAAGRELGRMVEHAIDQLPEIHRIVLILREIEGMTVVETAAALDVEEGVVKTRLHRARAALRSAIEGRVGEQMKNAFTFGNARCDAVVAAVLARLNPVG